MQEIEKIQILYTIAIMIGLLAVLEKMLNRIYKLISGIVYPVYKLGWCFLLIGLLAILFIFGRYAYSKYQLITFTIFDKKNIEQPNTDQIDILEPLRGSDIKILK